MVGEYDPTTSTWATKAPMPTARARLALARNGFNLYAIGGLDGSNTMLNKVERAVLTRLPSASAGGPYTAKTGQPVQLNGSGSDPDGDPVTFAWDVGGQLFFNVNGQSPSPAVTLKNGTYPVQVRALDSNGAYGVSSKTTLTVTCGPRPNVQVPTTRPPGTTGKIQATLTSGQGPFSGTLQIGLPARPPVNAIVDVQGGPQGITTTQSVPISGSQVVLTVTRRNPGNAPVTVPLSISDGCDAWNSFVGFGTGV